ncbi:hypothetical protein LguiB_010469 [Lonicera macranthoides]
MIDILLSWSVKFFRQRDIRWCGLSAANLNGGVGNGLVACDSQTELNNGVIPWRVIRYEPIRAILIRGLYAQKVETFAGGLCDSSSVRLYGLRLIESLKNGMIPWRVIHCEHVRAILIGGLYAQKVETFAGGLCDSSFVSLYGLRLIESVNVCAYSGLLRISPALQGYLVISCLDYL